MPAKELSPGHGLDREAKSRIRCQAGNNEKHLVVVPLQMEPTVEVAVMVIARIERIPEGLGTGDEFWVVSNVVQYGLRTQRHLKDLRTKWEHRFVRVLQGPEQFWFAKRWIFVE
jgi:hypothetical protein